MHQLASRFIIGLITFVLGVTASEVWVAVRQVWPQCFDAPPLLTAVQKSDGMTLAGISGLPVELLVWNEAKRNIVIDVRIDDIMIYDAVVGVAAQHPAIVVNEGHRIAPGLHRVVLTDRTRGIRREAEVLVAERAWIEVRLGRAGSELSIRYRNAFYE